MLNAIEIKNISKVYNLYKKPHDIIKEVMLRRKLAQEFWALRDINLSIPRGKVVGIIGRNGAGKSTLLKILARTIQPSTGSITINGKVSAILELGTGFSPDQSGRDNIIMGGMCLGMSKKEIEAKMDSIINFSELREFIDRPFKTYSSGMQARLTFSTAMSISPEILIVDEALAAGDALFQEKCVRLMKDICNSGATVLFVTHSLHYIYEICDTCVLLHEGRILAQGDTKTVGQNYESLLSGERKKALQLVESANNKNVLGHNKKDQDVEPEFINIDPICENENLSLLQANFYDSEKKTSNFLISGHCYTVRIKIKLKKNFNSLNIGFQFLRDTGLPLIGDTTYENGFTFCAAINDVVEVCFTFRCHVITGQYLLRVGTTSFIGESFETILDYTVQKVYFVQSKNQNGLVDPKSEISIKINGNPHKEFN